MIMMCLRRSLQRQVMKIELNLLTPRPTQVEKVGNPVSSVTRGVTWFGYFGRMNRLNVANPIMHLHLFQPPLVAARSIIMWTKHSSVINDKDEMDPFSDMCDDKIHT